MMIIMMLCASPKVSIDYITPWSAYYRDTSHRHLAGWIKHNAILKCLGTQKASEKMLHNAAKKNLTFLVWMWKQWYDAK